MPELEKLYSTEVGRLSLKGLLCLSHVVCKLHAVFQGFILRKVVQSVCNVRAARTTLKLQHLPKCQLCCQSIDRLLMWLIKRRQPPLIMLTSRTARLGHVWRRHKFWIMTVLELSKPWIFLSK